MRKSKQKKEIAQSACPIIEEKNLQKNAQISERIEIHSWITNKKFSYFFKLTIVWQEITIKC